MTPVERYRGALLGLAVGDALGTTLEFKPPGTFEPIGGMVGGGPFGLPPGYWTDDTSMALCLAESLIEKEGFDPVDQLERYVRWFRKGHLSSTGTCFDIGNTISGALLRFEKTNEPYCGSEDPRSAGNGPLMRLVPAPLAYAAEPAFAIEKSGVGSRTTHGAKTAVDACRYFAGLIVGAVAGESKETILSPKYAPIEGYWDKNPLCPEIDEVASGSFNYKNPPEIRGTGYVVRSLEAALWAFSKGETFEEGCLMAVNLGDDADTTGAIYGQIAGAFYGEGSIPGSWLDVLAHRSFIEKTAESLLNLSKRLAGAVDG